jgi:hypothetical protein
MHADRNILIYNYRKLNVKVARCGTRLINIIIRKSYFLAFIPVYSPGKVMHVTKPSASNELYAKCQAFLDVHS